MKYIFILLSDFHFTGTYRDEMVFEKKKSMIDCIKTKVENQETNVIFLVNGDIASTGMAKEYNAAKSFFKSVIYELKQATSVKNVDFIFSPGNHDCNFEKYDKTERASLYCQIDRSKINSEYDKYIMKISHYESFIKSLNFYGQKRDYRYFTEYNLEGINILSFNATLAYDFEYNKSEMIIDSEYVQDNASTDQSKIYISLSHYPLEWFNRNDEKNYIGIYKGMNILITSHEHNPSSDNIKNKCRELRLPAFNPTDQQAKSGFMILKIENNNMIWSEHRYSGSLFIEAASFSEKIIASNRVNDSLLYETGEIKDIFETNNILNGFDIKSGWSNFFVKPTLVKISDNKNLNELYQFIEFDNFICENKEVLSILNGSQFIGKTTILFNLLNKYMEMKLIPVYIDASKIQNDTGQINKAISKFISRVYAKSVDYVNQHTDKIILLVDNVHTMKAKFKEIISDLVSRYNKVIVTTNSQFFDDDLLNRIEFKYDLFDIMPFGNSQKFQLIENWVKNTTFEDEYRINQKISEVMSIVNKIDNDRNFMNTPTLLIVFLEAYEDKKTDNLMNGSKGVYYQYLIDKQIIHLSEKTEVESTFIEKYLTEYAYKQYEMMENFNESDLDTLFLDTYPISRGDYYTNIKKLKKAFNIDEVFQAGANKGIYFTNDLVFSYFVAKYLQKNQKILSNKIKLILDDISNPINSNILLFFLYFTQDIDVIESVVLKADSLFSAHEEVVLGDDINFINELIIGYKDISSVDNVRDKNQELNKKIDKIEYYKKIKKKGEDNSENNPILIERLSALRIADIASEVLNLFPNLNSYKKLVESIVRLSLRKTSDLVMLIFSYLIFLSDQPKEYLEKNRDQIHKYLNRLLATMVMIFIELSENLKNKKTKDFTKSVLESFERTTAIEMVKMILDVYFQRGEQDVNYNLVIKQKEKMIKSNNKFAAGMIHLIIDREVNYIGMQTRAKNELLKRLNLSKIQRYSSNPRKQLDNIQKNRKERLKILQQEKK